MYYIGWDIGIKNLAYCIIKQNPDYTEIIKELEIINLIDEPILYICSCFNKNGKNCKSKATYFNKINDKIYYCNKHYNLLSTKEKKEIKSIKPPKKCSKYSLEELGLRLFKALDNKSIFTECDYVIIENQPVLKNPTMKYIQIMLYSYFLIKNKNMKLIKLVNASNKLKVYKDKIPENDKEILDKIKDKYRKNKMTAIIHAKLMIDNDLILEKYNNHKKKDDLADAYLMTKYLINKLK